MRPAEKRPRLSLQVEGRGRPTFGQLGAAITQPMLDEYREASEAKKAGRESPVLHLAFWGCLVGVGALVVFALVRPLLM